MPFKVFAVNEILTAADVNDYLAEQAIATFTNGTARDAAIATATHGQFAFLTSTNTLQYYNGASWEDFSAGGAGGFENSLLLMGG
jgi:hypothetical protein